MKAWKHHIAEDFTNDPSLINDNGAGKDGTVFLDYGFMVGYLFNDRELYWARELDVEPDEIYKFHPFIARMRVAKMGGPFKPIALTYDEFAARPGKSTDRF